MAQPDIREKLLFTFALIIIFRFVSNVPVPGVEPARLDDAFKQSTVLGFMNIFSGGALSHMSVVAMGVYPYITSSIVMQLMVPLVPALQALSKPFHFVEGSLLDCALLDKLLRIFTEAPGPGKLLLDLEEPGEFCAVLEPTGFSVCADRLFIDRVEGLVGAGGVKVIS